MTMTNIHLLSVNIISPFIYLPPSLKPGTVGVLSHHLLLSAAWRRRRRSGSVGDMAAASAATDDGQGGSFEVGGDFSGKWRERGGDGGSG
ncbi:hypothetical protein OIU84_007289 [Salix udensis]|uniref:Uncharacterized protein n=1 Tax=Salix udensis TaxID=889485 RepID=A0AAD6JU32_9ROSI|nr:hypothetical protein OIU84_007289 [Salix udensis]